MRGKQYSKARWFILTFLAVISLLFIVMPAMAQQVKVPGVGLMDFKSAVATLEKAGLKGAKDKEVHSTIQREYDGKVYSQEPKTGALVAKGTYVRLVLYQYAGGAEIVVPNLVGQTMDAAVSDLKKYKFGIHVVKKWVEDPKLTAGIVRSQEPKAGQKAHIGSTVRLNVDIYNQDAPKVTVPDVKNLTVAEAQKKLKAAKLIANQTAHVKETAKKEDDKKVFAQDPAAGSSVLTGRTVTLTVWKYTETAIEVRFGLNSAKTAYTMAVRGGAQPYNISIQPSIPVVVGVFQVIPLQDNPKEPEWKFYKITSRDSQKVTFIIKDAKGKTHQYSAELKKLQR